VVRRGQKPVPHQRLEGPVQAEDLRAVELAEVVEVVKLFAFVILKNSSQYFKELYLCA
jgi:hypothetical protein